MTPRGRIIGLFAGLLGPSGAAGGALASTIEGHASRASSIQHAVNETLNNERAAAHVSRLRGSHILQAIANHRARVGRAQGTAYPGYDVSSDLRHFRVCFHAAREWEFAFTTTSPRRAARLVQSFAARIPGYRADLLRPGWHQFATGVATSGHTTYLIEDFAALC
jgi:hypothetical protein